MTIEAIIVSDGYSDFLAETLPRNLPQFDRVVVVTGFDDPDTLELCRRLSVECIPTDVMHKAGDSFNKGRAVDFGLSFLRRDAWVCHLDADIVLPPMARRIIEWTNPDESCIYGIDRVMCVGWSKWQAYQQIPASHRMGHDYHCRVPNPSNTYGDYDLQMPLGSRIALADHDGYVPIGFFQLFSGKLGRRYPRHQSDSAEHSDVLFALQWPRGNRRLMPDLIAIHLESEKCSMGANWKGRKTSRFGPPDCKTKPTGYCKA
jgi:hypothetical protein